MPLKPNAKISACLIVRDESRVLGRCLASINGGYDELCILDTGSTDNTPQIAKEFGAKLKRFIGCNGSDGKIIDFSLARNICLEMARGDWVLSIDADEVLQKSSIEQVRRHTLANENAAVRVRLRSKETEWPAIRLFRRLPEHKFVGRIHERISVSGPIANDPSIVIRNLPNKRGKESAALRDLRLCSLALEADPRDRRMIFYLAKALRRAGRFDAAIKEYERYLELEKDFQPGRHAATYGIATCHLLKGDWRRAVRVGKIAVAIDPLLAESRCLIADAYLALSYYGLAMRWYRSALNCKAPPPDYPHFVNRSFYSTYPLQQLKLFKVTTIEE